MKNLKLAAYIAALCLVLGCKKNDPDPDNQNINIADSNYVEYYMDGIKIVSDPTSVVIFGTTFIMYTQDNKNVDESNLLNLQIFGIDTIPQIYYLNDSLFGSSSNISLLPFYSNMCMYTGNDMAKISVTNIDFTKSLISGTFEGRVCFEFDTTGGFINNDSSTTVLITNGVFNNVIFAH